MKRTKKKWLLTALSLITAGCFGLGLASCKDESETEGISYNAITFTDQTVDVANAPDFVVEVGENKITKVLLDDAELKAEDYLVKNGYFAFAYENFQQMGLGVHNVKVVFEKGTKEFTVTVTDVQDAKIAISLEESYSIGDTVLPKAERLNNYQAFELSYSLTKEGVEVPMTENGSGFEVAFEQEGDYVYTVSVEKNGETKKNAYPIRVNDRFSYATGKEYVSQEQISYFSGTLSCEWDESREAIKASEYLGISNELIHRARYAGDNYLEVVLSTDVDNPSYGSFPYEATDKKSIAFAGEFYATDRMQTILIDLTGVNNKEGVTEIAKGNSGLPIWIYSAKFRKDPLTDTVNYAAHAYKKANIWTASDGDGTPWDYRVGDYMELWTYQTIMFKTSMIKQALSLGYTHLIYEAENSTNGATLYYNENVTSAQTDLTEQTATDSVRFENGRVLVAMNISGLIDSQKEWTYLAGVSTGKLLTVGLTFTSKVVTDASICFNGAVTQKQRVEVGETFDLTKFTVVAGETTVSDVVWTIDGEYTDMTNTALLLSEGIYTLKATIVGETGRGSAYCTLSVVRPLTSAEITGELVTEERMNLWQSVGEFRYTDKYIAQGQLSLSAMAIQKAKQDGKNYLEVTAFAIDGWLSIALNPEGTPALNGSASTFDGISTFVIDLTHVTADDGYVKLLWVNQFTVGLNHAEFIDKPVTEKVDYAHLVYAGDSKLLTATSGQVLSVNDINELKTIYDPVSQQWKAFMVAKAGTFGIKKSIVADAVAAGFTKVRLDVIGANGATNVYYGDNLSTGAVSTTGTNNATFTNKKRISITLDITNVTSIGGDYAYLCGTNVGWLVLAGMYFCN